MNSLNATRLYLSGLTSVVVGLLLPAVATQIARLSGDRRFVARGHTLARATGLGGPGRVRQFDAPHSAQKDLLNEFVHKIGRRYVTKLRLLLLSDSGEIVILAAFVSYLAGTLVPL